MYAGTRLETLHTENRVPKSTSFCLTKRLPVSQESKLIDDLGRLLEKAPTRVDYAERSFPNDFEFYKARSHLEREVRP